MIGKIVPLFCIFKKKRKLICVFFVVFFKILEIIRVILKLYDQWKNFDDRKEIAAVLNKMPKPKPPPNRYDWICFDCWIKCIVFL